MSSIIPELKIKLLSLSEVKLKAVSDIFSPIGYSIESIDVKDEERVKQPLITDEINMNSIVNVAKQRITKHIKDNPKEDIFLISVENGIVYSKLTNESYDVCYVVMYNPLTKYIKQSKSYFVNIDKKIVEKYLANKDKYETVGKVIEEDTGLPHNDWITGYTKGNQSRIGQIKSAIEENLLANDTSIYKDLETFAKCQSIVEYFPKIDKEGNQFVFKDLTPLYRNYKLFMDLVELTMMDKFKNVDYFIGVESRGYVLATILATLYAKKYNKSYGLDLVKKAGKVPNPKSVRATYQKEYGPDEVEFPKIDLTSKKVVICDDLIAFGGTATAAKSCMDQVGAETVAYAFVSDVKSLREKYSKVVDGIPVYLCLE